jgi:hypothetical protein
VAGGAPWGDGFVAVQAPTTIRSSGHCFGGDGGDDAVARPGAGVGT